MEPFADAMRSRLRRTIGVVLCGGHSRRMGKPKGWLKFGDEYLLQRVVRIIGEAVGSVIVVAAKGQLLPPMPSPANVRVIEDHVAGQGPLAGLSAALAAVDSDCDAVYLSGCDVPFLKPEFVQRVVDSLVDPQIDTAVPYTDRFHALAAVYRVSIRPVVEKRLSEGKLRVRELLNDVPFTALRAETFADCDPQLESLRNINHVEDYEAAVKEWNER